VPAQYQALDWLARRHAGESAALIASRAGVSESTVLSATKAYGPFPRPSHQLGRTVVTDEHHRQRAEDWIEQRRRGRSTAEIAREYGVSHQIVSRSTLGHGPFPSKDTLAAWVAARRQRRTLHDIAQEYQVPPRRIGHRTAAAGPYPAPVGTPRLPDGLLGIAAIADRVGLASPAVLRWRAAGRLPPPDFVTARGRHLWLATTIEQWLKDTDLQTCPQCGARTRSVAKHTTARHPQPTC
jgi:AraC-like DNA-binding protein